MSELHSGNLTVNITVDRKTGEATYRQKGEYPPEEALESLASRVRPLVLNSEPIYYEKALNALEALVGADKLNEEIDLAWWHGYWREVVDANLGAIRRRWEHHCQQTCATWTPRFGSPYTKASPSRRMTMPDSWAGRLAGLQTPPSLFGSNSVQRPKNIA
jgi:hypothetical protein